MKLSWIADRRGDAGPVLDQGRRPTCLSCATSSAHEDISGESRSVEFLHYSCRGRSGGVGTFEAVEEVLASDGHPPEAQWPYDPNADDALVVPPLHLAGPFAKAVMSATTVVDEAALAAALAGGALPVVGLVTTPEFVALKNAVLTEPGTHLGYHAVLLVGAATYEGPDTSRLLSGDVLMCVQNSWGSSWGVRGYGLIAPRAWNDMALVAAVLSTAKVA